MFAVKINSPDLQNFTYFNITLTQRSDYYESE